MEELLKFGKLNNDLIVVVPKVANFKLAFSFKELINKIEEFNNMILFMAETNYFDSSFIGALIYVTMKINKEKSKKLIVYGNDYVEEIFNKYSINDFFIIKKDIFEVKDIILNEIKIPSYDDLKYLKSVLEDHKILSTISKENYENFKLLIESLEKEIEKKEKEEENNDK